MSYDHPYSGAGDDSNFIKKHWNGNYSLAKSYWVNTFFVSLILLLSGQLLPSFFDERTQARYISVAALFLTALTVTVWCWSVVGTWRSAQQHVSRGGRSFWASAAQVAIVLSALRLLGNLVAQGPNLAEHLRVALGAQLGPETHVQLRADGRSVLVSGGINDDTAEKLRQALSQAPGAQVVVLSSRGGWVGQGLKVADVISSRNLATYVEDECSSACTIAFLAGRERAAAPKARIGFHAFRKVGEQDSTAASSTLQKAYREAGLSDSFIARVLETPSTKLWYPTNQELRQNGVLTRTSIGGETAAIATRVKTRQDLEATFLKTPAFAALKERYPVEFQGILDAAWSSAQAGRTDAELLTNARARVQQLEARLLPMATDDTLIRYYALMNDELAVLSASNADVCTEMLLPTGKAIDPSQLLPNDLVQKELTLLVDVIQTSGPENSAQTSKPEFEKRLNQLLKSLSAEQIRAIASDNASAVTPQEKCDAFAAYFRALNSIPLNQRARFLRALAASG